MMRRSLVAILCAALAVGISGALAGTVRPVIKITQAAPLTVQGRGFSPRERVRVTVVATRRFVHLARATARGAFTTSFGSVDASVDRCGTGLTVTARGATGDTARLKWPQPECPPSLGP
jgi:hypothetical protein